MVKWKEYRPRVWNLEFWFWPLVDDSNYEGPETLPYVQVNKLTSHSLKEAAGRHETSGSETKDNVLLTATHTVSSSPQFLNPQFLWGNTKGPRIPLCADLRERDHELSKLQSFTLGSKQIVQPLLWKKTLSACHYSSLYSILEKMV